MNRTNVAIALIFQSNLILICQRKNHPPFPNFWEFPGGKCEPNEPPEKCVIREVQEELALQIQPAQALTPIEYDYPNNPIRLHPFHCQLIKGTPQPLASQQIKWIPPTQLPQYPFPPANEKLIHQIIRSASR